MIAPVRNDLSPREIRNFGWITCAGFAVLGALAWYVGCGETGGLSWVASRGQIAALVLWLVGVAFAAVCTASYPAGRRLYRVWMTCAMYVGTVMSTIMLSVMFVVLLPVFALVRFADPLRMRFKPPGESYWEDHKHHESTLERTARPF